MPELNFKIKGDDGELKKTLANIAKNSKDTSDRIAKESVKAVDSEVKARQKAVKVSQEQKKASDDVVSSVNEEAKAQDRVTESIKRRKGAFDELTGKQLKPVEVLYTPDDKVAKAENKPIKSGLPAGVQGDKEAAQYQEASKAAADYGKAVADANKVATDSANTTTDAVRKTTDAIKVQTISEDTLKARLLYQQGVKSSATDPAVIAEYTKKIQDTQAEITKLGNIGKRGFDELGNRIKSTIGQQEILTARLKYFQDQLNYAKAPQSFVALNKKIEELTEQLNRLSNAGKKGFDDLGNKIKETDSAGGKLISTLKSIGAAILAAFSIQVIIGWAKEARELAAKGEGIREAFAKLDNGKTLELLRKATRGATADIDLMAAALRAKNFQIAPELLAKGLELAGKVSRQTGQDVTYLADSFVNGLGRKSLLILDNLQISQVQLRAEIKKTGDFQTAVANVVDEKLKSMGDVDFTSADKMAQWAAKIANIKESVGQKINFVLNYDGLKESTKQFYETGLEVQKLKNNIEPLLTKYDDLSAKAQKNGGITKLSKVEQSLLKDVIRQVGDEIPSAITQFDKYGNAMSISTDRAKDFIKQQILVMQALNNDRIDETTKKLGKLSKELASLDDKSEELTKTGAIQVPTYKGGGTGSGISSFGDNSAFRKATKDEIAAMIDRRKAVIGEVEKLNALLEADSGSLLSKRQKDNEEFQKINKVDDGKADEKARKAAERQAAADAAALSAQDSLEQRMQVLKDKYQRQGLGKEQEARQAIVDEFKKLAFDIEQQGIKYDAYAKKYGAARATAVLGPKQTTESIEPIRTAALDDLYYRQDTARFELNITKQKDLFEAYENWKRTFGEESAKKRYGEELDTSTTYLKKLQDNYSKLVFKSVVGTVTGTTTLTGGEQEKLNAGAKLIEEAQRNLKAKQDNDYSEAYQAALTHSQKIAKINEDYRKKAKDLGNSITEDQKEQLLTQRNDAIDAAKDTALQRTAIYRKLANETIIYTQEETKNQIENIQKLLADGKIPADFVPQIQKQLNDLKFALKVGSDQASLDKLKEQYTDLVTELNQKDKDGNTIISKEEFKRITTSIDDVANKIKAIDKNGDGKISYGEKLEKQFKYLSGSSKEVAEGLSSDLGRLSSGFNDLSAALGGNDTQAGYLLDTIGKLAQAGSDAAGAFASFSSGDIIGGITKTMSAVSSVLSIGKKVKDMNAAARKEVEDFYAAAIKGETDYQALLRKRDLDSVARGKNSYQAIIAQLDALKKQSPEIQKAYDKIFSALQGEEYKDGTGYQHGTWVRKAKTWDIMASLAGSDYDRLEDLNSQGKLIGDAKTNFDSLKALHDELDAAGISTEDLKKQLAELLTGTSTSELSDGLKALFENGKRSAQDFGDSFESIIKNALLSSFNAKFLQDKLQPFYDELADMMQKGTPSADQIAALKEKYIQIGKDSDDYLKNIEAITGQNLSADAPGSSDTLSGRITSITSDQADKLAGLFNGFRITQMETNDILRPIGLSAIEMLSVSRSHLESALRTEIHAGKISENTAQLGDIRKALISMDSKMSNTTNILQGTGRG